jgi:hypothetical protein
MITDLNLTLSGAIAQAASGTGVQTTMTGQTATGTNTSVLSTNTIDLGTARDIGKGEMLEVVVEVITAASGGTSVQFQLIQADDAALTTNVQVIVQTDAIAVATLVAGTQVPLHVSRVDPYPARRYLGLRYVFVGAVAAGAYFAGVVKSVADKQVNYANGFAVL